MGSAESTALQTEKERWGKDHELGINHDLKTPQMALVAQMRIGSELKLVRARRRVLKNEYLHYAVTDGNLFIVFGDGQPSPQQHLMIYHIPGLNKDAEIEKTFKVTEEVRDRIIQVCGATKYSVLLRNSEHLARYIQCGTWCSLQMTGVTPIFKDLCGGGCIDKATKALINTLPVELQNSEVCLIPSRIYADWQPAHPYNLVFAEQRRVPFELENSAHNVALLGPSGAGKSNLINMIFNETVAESRATCQSVTRNMTVYTGTFTDPGCGSTRTVNILDTIGMCDSALSANDVISLVKQFLKNQFAILDKVIIVTSGRIEKAHSDAIRNFLGWLQYENHKTEFLFVYNKTDQMSEACRLELVGEMCACLGVDPRQAMTVPDSHQQRIINCAFATGFPQEAFFKDVSEDLEVLTTAALHETPEKDRIHVDTRATCLIL